MSVAVSNQPAADVDGPLRAFVERGDVDAFAQIVRQYGPMVIAVARRQMRDSHAADDVAQATFIVLARRAASIRRHQSLGAWLHRTTLLAARNAQRLAARRQRHEREAGMMNATSPPPTTGYADDLLIAIDARLDRLAARDRQIIALRFFEDLSISQIADRLKLSTDAAKKRLQRALDRLRGELNRDVSTQHVAGALGAIALPPMTIDVTPLLTTTTTTTKPAIAPAVAKGTIHAMRHATITKAISVTVIGLFALGGEAAAVAMLDDAAPATPVATQAPAPPKSPTDLRWDALAAQDPASTRALLELSRTPAETTGYIKSHLAPLKLSIDELNAAIDALESEDESVWRPAFDKLTYFDPRLAEDLETLMERPLENRAHTRLVEVLSDWPAGQIAGKEIILREMKDGDGFNFFDGNASWWAEHRVERIGRYDRKPKWSRAVRAIELLRMFNTPESITVLRELSTGHPEAQPTVMAKQALEELERQPTSQPAK